MFENSDFTDDDIRNLSDPDRRVMLRELGKHPALHRKFHPMNKEASRLYEILNRTDKETRDKQATAAQKARVMLPDTQKEITAIEQSKEFLDHLSPGHKKAHAKWLSLFAEPRQPAQEAQ